MSEALISNLATLYSYNFIRASFVDIGTKAELSYLNQKGTIKISIIHCGTRVVQLKAQSVDLLLIAFLNRRGGRLPAVILVGGVSKEKALPLRGKAFSFVGVAGFEPATLWSQTRCANRAALHPEKMSKY